MAGTTTYEWNALGQLAIVGSADVTATYSYGATGMRERKVVARPGSAKTTDSFWIGEQLVSEKDSDGKVYTYVYGPGGLPLELVVTSGATSTSYAYVTDALGSVVGLAGASGNAVASYRYDPWGRVIEAIDWNSSGLAARQPLRYRGYYHDTETGLYYLPARYYDPVVARFISVDPSGPMADDPTTLNAYVYCVNSPLLYSDPSGETIDVDGDGRLDSEDSVSQSYIRTPKSSPLKAKRRAKMVKAVEKAKPGWKKDVDKRRGTRAAKDNRAELVRVGTFASVSLASPLTGIEKWGPKHTPLAEDPGLDFALSVITQPSATVLLAGAAAAGMAGGLLLICMGVLGVGTVAGAPAGVAAVAAGAVFFIAGVGCAYAAAVSYEEVDGGDIPGFRDHGGPL
ncbi:MAG: RHS repeat-associated core domain-containing protein [Actinomycetota bacterium]|nr:RHS repeat-associated core domain-containing protein [Actinomycetota bacterium]